MREVIHMQVGRCGTRVGTKFWETIAKEHGIGPTGLDVGASESQLERVETYFKEVDANRRFPRSVIAESELDSLDVIIQSSHRSLFRFDNFVIGRYCADNNWAKGYYKAGGECINQVMDVVRKEAEICDSLQGFDLNHSLGGGTGSGLGALIMGKVREEYPKCLISTFSTFPSKVMDFVTEPYNTILSIPHLAENANMTYCLDNKALYNMAYSALKIRTPYNYDINHYDINHLASMIMSGITTCLRFSGPINSDLHALVDSMIPFPKLHFMTSSFVSTYTRYPFIPKVQINEFVEQLFHMHNMIAAFDPLDGHYFAGMATFRGKISLNEIRYQALNIRDILIANNIKLNVCEIPVHGTEVCGTFLGNTTGVTEMFDRIMGQFEAMLRRKTYIQWYGCEGLEETEFTDAANYTKDLISEYINQVVCK